MNDRAIVLRNIIHNYKQLFDMKVFRGHDLTNEWKRVNQYPWELLQENIAPYAAELRQLETLPKRNLYLVDHKPELVWMREHGISERVMASALGLTVVQVREILGSK